MKLTVLGRRRFGAAVLLVAVFGLVSAIALSFLGPSAEKRSADVAGAALEARVSALSAGESIDFSTAVNSPWERALFFDAYVPGDQMNQALGFEWFDRDAQSGTDDTRRRLLFVTDRTVMADVRVNPETFHLDFSGTAFSRSEAVFLASRAGDGVVTLARP